VEGRALQYFERRNSRLSTLRNITSIFFLELKLLFDKILLWFIYKITLLPIDQLSQLEIYASDRSRLLNGLLIALT
jgi:hypothetical protein